MKKEINICKDKEILKLKEINLDMGKEEYNMFQNIPNKEPGSTNLCKGIEYAVFKDYLELQMSRKYTNISVYDTPTIMYILYVNEKPIGYFGIRTKIDNNWKNWCGNIFYTIMPCKRGKGYGKKLIELGLEKCLELNLKEVFLQCSKNNIASSKCIIANKGLLLDNEGESLFYKIMI